MSDKKLHVTGYHKLVYAALKVPQPGFKDKTKLQYSVRMEVDETTPEGLTLKKLLMSNDPRRISVNDQKGKRVAPEGKFYVTFKSQFAPTVVAEDGKVLDVDSIPFFNSKTDSAKINVKFELVQKGDVEFINLKVVKFKDLKQEEKPKLDYDEFAAELAKDM